MVCSENSVKRKLYSYEYLPPTLKEKYQVNNLKKQEWIIQKLRWKELIKVRPEVNEIETKRSIQKSMKQNCSFKKTQ